jgi:hypothetical protein
MEIALSPRAITTQQGATMTLRKLCNAALLAISFTGTAYASPIVNVGSSYSVYLTGEASGNVLNTGPVAFDSNAATFTRAGLNLSLTESQTDLSNGKHSITITMLADGELFPSAGEAADFGLGTLGTGLDLLSDVFLDTAHITLIGANGSPYFSTGNLADDYRVQFFSGAWKGYFADVGTVFGIGNVGGRDTRGFSFVFEVTEIPEPNAAALVALALLALTGNRSLRRRK